MTGRSWAAPDAVDWGAEGSCVVPSAPRHSTDREELESLILEQQRDMRSGGGFFYERDERDHYRPRRLQFMTYESVDQHRRLYRGCRVVEDMPSKGGAVVETRRRVYPSYDSLDMGWERGAGDDGPEFTRSRHERLADPRVHVEAAVVDELSFEAYTPAAQFVLSNIKSREVRFTNGTSRVVYTDPGYLAALAGSTLPAVIREVLGQEVLERYERAQAS